MPTQIQTYEKDVVPFIDDIRSLWDWRIKGPYPPRVMEFLYSTVCIHKSPVYQDENEECFRRIDAMGEKKHLDIEHSGVNACLYVLLNRLNSQTLRQVNAITPEFHARFEALQLEALRGAKEMKESLLLLNDQLLVLDLEHMLRTGDDRGSNLVVTSYLARVQIVLQACCQIIEVNPTCAGTVAGLVLSRILPGDPFVGVATAVLLTLQNAKDVGLVDEAGLK